MTKPFTSDPPTRPLCAPSSDSGLNPDLWFSANGSDESRLAKQTCMSCPFYFPCAEYALDEGVPFGIFGGMDERERRVAWKKRGGKPSKFNDDLDAALGVFTNTFKTEAVA